MKLGALACTLIPALGRQRQADLCRFGVGMIYIGSSRTLDKTS